MGVGSVGKVKKESEKRNGANQQMVANI